MYTDNSILESKVTLMNRKTYVENCNFIAGTTFKDTNYPECNNMALHICQDEDNILVNRRALAEQLAITIDDFVCANQTHSANMHRVTLADKGRGARSTTNAIADCDALYTYEPNILLCSFTADCVPVLFYNEKAGLVGAIHSGWQGTVKEITKHCFNELVHNEHCKPQDFTVIIGTALSQKNFEVDRDVYDKFKALGYADDFMYFKESTQKYHIDNQLTVKKQCELAGIPSANITIDTTCTLDNELGFSYRQNKQDGRHVSYIMLKNTEAPLRG